MEDLIQELVALARGYKGEPHKSIGVMVWPTRVQIHTLDMLDKSNEFNAIIQTNKPESETEIQNAINKLKEI